MSVSTLSMEELLRAWGCESLVQHFVDQRITKDALLYIDGELLKELVPAIGDRFQFTSKRQEYLSKHQCERPAETQDTINDELLSGAPSSPSPSRASSASGVTSAADPSGASIAGSPLASTSAGKGRPAKRTTASGASSRASGSAGDTRVTRRTTASGASSSAGSSRGASSSGLARGVGSKSPFVQGIVAQFSLSSFIASLDLDAVFQRHLKAGNAADYYNAYGFLSNACRTSIVDALASHILAEAKIKGCLDSIKNHHLCQLADRICQRFEGEDKSVYYTPPSPGVIADGKLPRKFRNSRKFLKAKKSCKSVNATEESVDDPTLSSDDDSSVDVEGAINFLACTRSPWPEVEQKWKWTLKLRRKRLADGKSYPLVNDYFEAWPVLLHPSGCTLLESDFNTIYPGRELAIFSRWPLFEDKVLKLAETDLHDKSAKRTLQLLKPTSSEDSRAAIIFSILPAICIPTHHLTKPNKERWVPTIAECLRSLILIVEAEMHIRRSLQTLRETQAVLGLRMQPIIVVVGKLEKISKCFVAIDKVVWRCTCFKKAIDTCFKSIFATDTHYPSESAHIWEAIQKSIYGIHKKSQDSFKTALDKI